MKLRFKPIFWLLGAFLAVFVLFLAIQQYRAFASIKELYTQNIAALEAREWLSAENLNQSVERSVRGSLERGEMEKFTKLLEAQREIDGLLEFSLYDRTGALAYSSDPKAINKKLPPELSQTLLRDPTKVKRMAADAFEIYQPQLIQPDCLRCHKDWPTSGVACVQVLRFSTNTLAKAKQDWTNTSSRLRAKQMKEAVGGALVVCLCFFALTVLVVRTRIAGPLTRAIELARKASNRIAESSNQLTDSGQALAQGANQQAASLSQTRASLEKVSGMIQKNVQNVQEAKSLTGQTRFAADAGASEMQAMSAAMDAIKASSDDIAKILKTIDEVAFQTNILALNAAVEAARAGEAGLGFAVVAEEVRNLAQRSASAARETASKVENAIANAKRGVEMNSKVAGTFAEILAKARQVDELAGAVAAATQEQSHDLAQITTAVSEIDKVTQNNADSAQESATAAEALQTQAGSLREVVSELLTLVGEIDREAPANNLERQIKFPTGPDAPESFPATARRRQLGAGSGAGKEAA